MTRLRSLADDLAWWALAWIAPGGGGGVHLDPPWPLRAWPPAWWPWPW